MTTIHAYTSDQRLNDALHDDLYRARAAAQSMIPTKTGAAVAIGEVLPQLWGRLDGLAVRVPTLNVSLVDLTFTAQQAVTAPEVNDLMRQAAANDQKGVLAYKVNSTGRRNTFDQGVVYGTTCRVDEEVDGARGDAFARCAVTAL